MRKRDSVPSDRRRSGHNDRRRGSALLIVLLPIAVLTAVPVMAQPPSGRDAEDIVRAAYANVLASAPGYDRSFQISVDSFAHYATAEFDELPRAGFVTLPQDGFIEGTFSYAGGKLSWAPAWRLEEDPSPEPESGEDTIQTLLQLAGADDPVWLDAVGVTRYTVTLVLQGTQRVYKAAAYWFPPSGTSDYEVRFVDWVLQDLTAIVTWDSSGIVTTPPPEPAAGDQCIPENYGPFTPPQPFQADDSNRTRQERDHTNPFFPAYHRVEANASVACSCKEDCLQECEPAIPHLSCKHVGNPVGSTWRYHARASNFGLHKITDFVAGAGCKVAVKCAFRGCTSENCAFSVGTEVTAGVITFTLTPHDTIIWQSPPLSWQMNCPSCTRLFNVSGDVTGNIPPHGSLKLVYTTSSIQEETEPIYGPGPFEFQRAFPEGQQYIIKKSEQCVSCQLTGGSGTLTGHVNDVHASCQPAACSRVGFNLSFETSGGQPSNEGGPVLVRLAHAGGLEPMNVTEPGTYEFDTSLNQGTAWVVDAQSSPPVNGCSVVNGEDQAGGSGIQYADIVCTVGLPPGYYSVTAKVRQQQPYDSITLRLEAAVGPGGSLETVDTASSESGVFTSYVTFNEPLPDDTNFAIFPTSPDPEETCEPAANRIRGQNAEVPVYCYTFTPPPPPPPELEGGPGAICAIMPVVCNVCFSTTNIIETPCPPDTNCPHPDPAFCKCGTHVKETHCVDLGTPGAWYLAGLVSMTHPIANGGPIQIVDDSLPLVASASHAEGVLSMSVILDDEVAATYPAAGSPPSFDLPVTSLDTSGLTEGEHTFGVYAVTNGPSGPVAAGSTRKFIVDHQGGGGGGSDTTPPEVTLVSPLDQSTHPPGLITVTATATDDSGIDRVEFFRNGVRRHTATGTLYEWEWDATENPGWNQLKVKAYDASPNQNPAVSALHYVNIQEAPCGDPTPPTVNLTEPAAGSTHTSGSQIRLSASAGDDVAVTKVEFFVDSVKVGTATSSPYWFDWTSSGTGPREITAKAFDACNSTVSTPRTITLVSNPCSNPPPPPTVSLTAPVNGSGHTTGVPLTISADASPGTTKVEFWRNTSQFPIGVDTTAPYSVSWTPGGTAGSVTLTAKAYDGCSTTTSAGRTITLVSNPCAGDTNGPTVEVTWPPSGSLPASEAWETRASATDPEGNGVDLVEFFVNGSSAGTDDDGAPWEVDWLPLPEPGAYSVKARAVDGCGNEKFSPTINVTLTTGPNPDPPQDP